MHRTVRGLLKLMVGLVVFVVGYGMWKSPHLDWELFVRAWRSLGVYLWNELTRMLEDPFAIVGLILLAVGVWVVVAGIKDFF